jgi:hypothetical protein
VKVITQVIVTSQFRLPKRLWHARISVTNKGYMNEQIFTKKCEAKTLQET